jgi:hypothetical protein
MSTKQAYIKANLDRFKAVVESDQAKTIGVIPALIKSGFGVMRVGNTTKCVKGRAIISYKGSPNLAEVTLLSLT